MAALTKQTYRITYSAFINGDLIAVVIFPILPIISGKKNIRNILTFVAKQYYIIVTASLLDRRFRPYFSRFRCTSRCTCLRITIKNQS